MYNGIGLQTARGTGTNGYVQTNLSHLLLSRRRIEYNAEDDIKRQEAELNKAPNEELLDHQRKRQIELKCAEFETLMENKGFDNEDIEKKVSDYRRLLLSQLESGELNVDDEISTRDTHVRKKVAAQNRERWKEALGIRGDFVPGSSMQNMNKNENMPEDEAAKAAAAKNAEEAKRMESLVKLARKEQKKQAKAAKKKKKEKKKKAAAKKRRRKQSSSSSSSTSDSSSDSDSSSSSDSSSESDSSSDDSDREERKRRKAKSKRDMKKKTRKEPVKEEAPSSDDEEEKRKGKRGDDRRDRGDRKEREKETSRRDKDRRDDDGGKKGRIDLSSDDDRGRTAGGRDPEIKQEPASSDNDRNSPYVNSDLDEATGGRMKSMVKVVKK